MPENKTVSLRSVARVVPATSAREGGGFVVRRPFPTEALDHLDPFLLLDEMGPVDYAPGEAKGAPDHPHRGFETVTYLIEGEFEHKDSAGHAGHLAAGDAQWMTAGAGVVHAEMPSAKVQQRGGRVHGFQLWVNLPARDKMMAPRYQEIPAARLPVATSSDGKVAVKVLAGEAMGKAAVIDTRTPIVYAHFTMQPGGEVLENLPRPYNVLAYVWKGEGRFGREGRAARSGDMVIFSQDGQAVVFGLAHAAKEPMEVLLLGGQPLGDPVVRYGPFVMNTREQIAQAIDDFRAGRMGKIPPG
jgi:hypothetical protein